MQIQSISKSTCKAFHCEGSFIMKRIRRGATLLVVVVGFLILGHGSLEAQVTTGSIEGFVTDSSGAVVPGTPVVAKNPDTNYSRTVVSQADGSYRFLLLPVGRYTVSFSKEGFQTLLTGCN